MEKETNITNILLCLVLVALIIIAGIFGYKEFGKGENKDKNTNTQQNENTNNNNQQTNNKEENNNTPKDFDLTDFDGTKCIEESCDTYYYKLSDYVANNIGFTKTFSQDKKKVNITLDFTNCNQANCSGYDLNLANGKKEYSISFDKKIKEVYFYGFGQAVGYETIFYLMEDGTVEYTPVRQYFKTNNPFESGKMKSEGKIYSVSDVVKLALVTDEPIEQYKYQYLGGGYNVLGIKADGTFYNLSRIIRDYRVYSW